MLRSPMPLLISALLAIGPGLAKAADDAWQLRGFASLGGVYADDAQLGFRRDISHDTYSLDAAQWRADSLLGLQLNRSFGERVDVAVQAVLRDRPRQTLRSALEWAFLRYRAGAASELRLGRMGIDLFMLSDYRNVGYAYPWQRPPPDFYGFVPLFSFDGADFMQRWTVGQGSLQAKLYAGVSSLDVPAGDDDAFRLHVRPIRGLALLYERDPWRARLSYTRATLRDDVPLGALPAALAAASVLWPEADTWRERLRLADSGTVYATAGLAYDDARWLLQVELARIDSDSLMAPQARAAYLGAGRRFGEFTLFALLSRAKPLHPLPEVELPSGLPPFLLAPLLPLQQGVEQAIRSGRVDQRGRGIGLRWDFAPQKALTLQWDRWRVAGDGALLWWVGDDFDGRPRTVNVVGLSLDLLF